MAAKQLPLCVARTRARCVRVEEIARVFEVRARFLELPWEVRCELYTREVRNDPRLPSGWAERRSRNDEVYFRDVANGTSHWDFPEQLLLEGWTLQVSTIAAPGVRYFAHPATKTCQWSFPRADAQWMLPPWMPAAGERRQFWCGAAI